MGNFGSMKKPIAEHVYGDLIVWQCSSCNCWSRDEFIYVEEPTCPICHEKMERSTKYVRVE